MLQLTREGVGRIRVLVHVVRPKQRFLGTKLSAKSRPMEASVKTLPLNSPNSRFISPGRVHSGVILPAGNFTGRGNARKILLGKPHVVGEVAAVNGEQFLRRRRPVHRERRALLARREREFIAFGPLQVEIRDANVERIGLFGIEFHFTMKGQRAKQFRLGADAAFGGRSTRCCCPDRNQCARTRIESAR